MTDPTLVRSLLLGEAEALEPFAFVAVRPAGKPLALVEITRGEDGGLVVQVPGRPPIAPELPVAWRSGLRERGFASEDPADRGKPWTHAAPDAAAAVDLVQRVLTEVFGEAADTSLDVAHGSHRQEHELALKLAALRERIEKVVTAMYGKKPEQDEDGDYVIPVNDVHVVVAPRAVPGVPALVRVFSVTNVGIGVTPELGLFLANLNFGLMFGRFALDAAHRSVWFDETLLGDHFSDEELRFAIEVVANTADHWDDRLKQMFGGATWQEVLREQAGPSSKVLAKPGEGGYL